ncbi:sugar ABC transporter substrate-binding protein [Flindersiella endophytica]
MKLVKIAAVATALAFGLAAAGCGSGDGGTTSNQPGKKGSAGGDKPASITVWRFGDPTDPHKQFMDEVNADFTKQTGVKVNVSWIAWPDVPDKLSAAAAGGKGPDVTEIGNTDVLTWAGQDALADITENVEAWDEAKGIPDNLWSYEKLDGGTYAVPWLGGARVVYYRKDWFDELDIKTPTNWTELEAAAQKIVAAKGKGTAGFAINGGSDAIHTIAPFIWGNGGEIATKDGDTWVSKVDEPAAKEAIEFYSGLVTKSKVSPAAYAGKNSVEIQSDFINGKVGMYLEGSWGIAQITDPKKGKPELADKVGTFALPAKTGGPAPQFAGGNDLAVWNDSQAKDVAFDYVKLIAGKKYVEKYAPISGLLPEYTELLQSDAYTKDPKLAPYAQAFAVARGYPTSPNWVEVDQNKTVLQTAVRDIVQRKKSADQAVQDAAKEMDTLLNQ